MEVNLERIRDMRKAYLDGVEDFKNSVEGKKWCEERGAELFKVSMAGKKWAQGLSTDAVARAVKGTVTFANSKVSGIPWKEFHWYNIVYFEDDSSSGSDKDEEGDPSSSAPGPSVPGDDAPPLS